MRRCLPEKDLRRHRPRIEGDDRAGAGIPGRDAGARGNPADARAFPVTTTPTTFPNTPAPSRASSPCSTSWPTTTCCWLSAPTSWKACRCSCWRRSGWPTDSPRSSAPTRWDVRKPHPGHLLGTIERAGGDEDPRDHGRRQPAPTSTRAKAAGVPVIAVDFGYTEIPVTELGPDHVISHYDSAVRSGRAAAGFVAGLNGKQSGLLDLAVVRPLYRGASGD